MGKISKSDQRNFVMFTLLYFIQGIPLGLWSSTLMLILLEHEIPYTNLALLSLAIYPFSFKILTAPLLDVYYFKSIGKRRTYIIPIQIILAIIYAMLYTSQITTWIYNVEILAAIGFLIILLVAHQDIAVDGWVLTAFSADHNHLGATAQSVGQMLGGICSTTIFMTLNSKNFCNSYIYSTPQEQGILSLETFCLFNSIYLIGITTYIYFFTHETPRAESIEEIKQHEIKQVFHNLKALILNKNIQKLFLHLILFRFSFQPLLTSTSQLMIAQGLRKEMIAYVQTLLIPISLLIIGVIGKHLPKKNEFQNFFNLLIFRLFESVLTYILFKMFPDILTHESIYSYCYLIFFGITSSFLTNAIFINHGTLFNRISDPQVGATYLTLLNSIHNLGGAIAESLSILSLTFLSYDLVAFFTFIYAVFYIIFMKKPLLRLSEINKKEWAITEKQIK